MCLGLQGSLKHSFGLLFVFLGDATISTSETERSSQFLGFFSENVTHALSLAFQKETYRTINAICKNPATDFQYLIEILAKG
jgi:hypothetical protein